MVCILEKLQNNIVFSVVHCTIKINNYKILYGCEKMISYSESVGNFNYRVGAIIIDQISNKLLINKKPKGSDWWVVPGGRAELMENSKETVVREMQEELNLSVEPIRLLVFSESFFKMRGIKYHEISLYYLCKIIGNSDIYNYQEQFFGAGGENDLFQWISLNSLNKIKFEPLFLVDIVKNIPTEMVHIINDNL